MMWKVFFLALAAVLTVASASMVGGPRDIDVNDEGLRNALNFAVVQHNSRTNDMYLSQVTEVISAQSQVVAGIKYLITVKMARTSCRKGYNEICSIQQEPPNTWSYQCTFTVWSRPWLGDISLLKEEC
ncbi:hypothetical protein PAMP_001850 [Pampus punctatissimus]